MRRYVEGYSYQQFHNSEKLEVKYSLEEIGHNAMLTCLEYDALIEKNKAICIETQSDSLEK